MKHVLLFFNTASPPSNFKYLYHCLWHLIWKIKDSVQGRTQYTGVQTGKILGRKLAVIWNFPQRYFPKEDCSLSRKWSFPLRKIKLRSLCPDSSCQLYLLFAENRETVKALQVGKDSELMQWGEGLLSVAYSGGSYEKWEREKFGCSSPWKLFRSLQLNFLLSMKEQNWKKVLKYVRQWNFISLLSVQKFLWISFSVCIYPTFMPALHKTQKNRHCHYIKVSKNSLFLVFLIYLEKRTEH